MTDPSPPTEFLLLSRGQWDPARSKSEIQAAIDAFYHWYETLVAEGRFKPGQRLATGGRVVSGTGITDGPYAETKELIGGYWFIVAANLDEAAALAGRNPCIACGLTFEIRPIETERASAYKRTNETPGNSRTVCSVIRYAGDPVRGRREAGVTDRRAAQAALPGPHTA